MSALVDEMAERNRLAALHAEASAQVAQLGHALIAEQAAHAETRAAHARTANLLLRELAEGIRRDEIAAGFERLCRTITGRCCADVMADLDAAGLAERTSAAVRRVTRMSAVERSYQQPVFDVSDAQELAL